MNKFVIAALSFTAGAIAGFTISRIISRENEEPNRVSAEDIKKEMDELIASQKKPEGDVPEKVSDPAEEEFPQDDDPTAFISRGPAHVAKPGQKGINYAKVNQVIVDNGYTDPADIESVLEDPDNEETYEEREEREALEETLAMAEYRSKNKGKIAPMTKEEWESDFQENLYDKQDLYYFVGDDVLTDEDGNHLDEEEYIGVKPRQFGWMANDEEKIYIRNHPKETDYQVWKEKCSSEDWGW